MEEFVITLREFLEVGLVAIISYEVMRKKAPVVLGVLLGLLSSLLLLPLLENIGWLGDFLEILTPLLILSFALSVWTPDIKKYYSGVLTGFLIVFLFTFREGAEIVTFLYTLSLSKPIDFAVAFVGSAAAFTIIYLFYKNLMKLEDVKSVLNASMFLLLLIASSMFAEGIAEVSGLEGNVLMSFPFFEVEFPHVVFQILYLGLSYLLFRMIEKKREKKVIVNV